MADVLYDKIGQGYVNVRRPDPRIAHAIFAALGDAKSVINVGAGAGSYEPTDREVLAIEPSEVMIAQRPPGSARCIRSGAESLPVENASFDAAMAVATIHHWTDWRRGLAELRRVARRRVVILTMDPEAAAFWFTTDYWTGYLPHIRSIMPPIDEMAAILGPVTVTPVLVPHDCTDGFIGAFWRRPEIYLDPTACHGLTASTLDGAKAMEDLAADLRSGRWHARNGHIMTLDALDVGYRLVHAEIGAAS